MVLRARTLRHGAVGLPTPVLRAQQIFERRFGDGEGGFFEYGGGSSQNLPHLRSSEPENGKTLPHLRLGWRYLSNATCLMRPRWFYAGFVV